MQKADFGALHCARCGAVTMPNSLSKCSRCGRQTLLVSSTAKGAPPRSHAGRVAVIALMLAGLLAVPLTRGLFERSSENPE